MLSEQGTIYLCATAHGPRTGDMNDVYMDVTPLVAKLERVARAAEEAWPFMFNDIPKKLNSKRSRYEELYDALADLPEDALKD